MVKEFVDNIYILFLDLTRGDRGRLRLASRGDVPRCGLDQKLNPYTPDIVARH